MSEQRGPRTLGVGLIAEGVTDLPIFEGVLSELAAELGCDDLQVTLLQPRRDDLTGAKTAGGWYQVKLRCQQMARRSELPGLLSIYDLLVVQVDQDVLGLAEFGRCPSAAALCDEVHGWLGLGDRHPRVVVALPARSTDAWLLARVAPELGGFESVTVPKAALSDLGIGAGAPKYRRAWQGAAAQAGADLARLCAEVPELRRFALKVGAAFARMGPTPDGSGD